MSTPVASGIKVSNLADALINSPPNEIFVTEWRSDDDIHSVTFGKFLTRAQSHAAELHARGLRPGDRVVLIHSQGLAGMAAFAGAILLGAVPALLAFPNFKVDREKYISGLIGVTRNLQARLVAVDDGFPTEFEEYLTSSSGASLVRLGDGSRVDDGGGVPFVSRLPEDIAFIQHSAGTTGLQKGVAVSHKALLTQLFHLTAALKINDRDRIYSWLPLYHDMGLIACFMLPLVYHLPVVMQSPTNWVMRPATMLRLISDYRCTLSWIPNFTLQFLSRRVREDDRMGIDLSSLRGLINCSEPVHLESMEEFYRSFESCGLRATTLSSSYAMAENTFAVTQSEIGLGVRHIWIDRSKLHQEHLAVPIGEHSTGSLGLVSSGRCLPGNRVRIVSSNGTDLPDGSVGEILIQSDSLFEGYYNRPDLTAVAIRDGWYWSGDLGFTDQGEIYVIGRSKDLIIVAGKNIYPQDLEQIACLHPAVHDGRAVAFALFNRELGTEEIIVVAELQSDCAPIDSIEIEREIRNAIAAELDVVPRAICLKPPRWIIKSTAGKPARSTTREKLLKEHPEFSEQ